jgi:hypothetical protein
MLKEHPLLLFAVTAYIKPRIVLFFDVATGGMRGFIVSKNMSIFV